MRHQLQEKAGKKERKTTSLRCRVQADGMLNFIVLPAISLFTTRFQLAVPLLMLSRTMGNVTQCQIIVFLICQLFKKKTDKCQNLSCCKNNNFLQCSDEKLTGQPVAVVHKPLCEPTARGSGQFSPPFPGCRSRTEKLCSAQIDCFTVIVNSGAISAACQSLPGGAKFEFLIHSSFCASQIIVVVQNVTHTHVVL